MIGSASIGAVSSKGTAFAIKNMITQSIYVAIGVFIMMVLTKGFKLKMINYRSSMAVYIMGIISMCGCVFWTTKGSHAWIIWVLLQYSQQFMKIGMVLILSYMLTETDSAFVVKGKFRTAELKSKFYKDKFKQMCFVSFSSYGFCIWSRSYCTKGFRKFSYSSSNLFYLFYVNTKRLL